MKEEQILAIVQKQRAYFESGATLPIDVRVAALKKLRQAILSNEKEIHEALYQDLGKSVMEGYMCEVGLVLEEIRYLLKHIHSFAKQQRVKTPLSQFKAHSYKKPMPYGVVLIMSPWNYPFLLSIQPLVEALAAGNTVVLKPSAYAQATSSLIQRILENNFPKEYIAVVTGGRAENACLLEQKFDYIFFTGSKGVGQLVLQKAAKYLTPVTLELGGKSPCIVEHSADLNVAARRIVFGKYLNCGQTCVAPDYILCEASVKEALVEALKKEVKRQFGTDYIKNKAYGKIITQKHFERIQGLIDADKVVLGGRSDESTQKIEPTILDCVTWQDKVMQEEIFGPVLPILTFESVHEVIETVNGHEKPLACYVFSNDKAFIEKITSQCIFGGGCVNDVVIHLATTHMGFGGVGESGMGAYHGKTGFDTFTHYKSIVDKKVSIDLNMRYQPYTKIHYRLVRRFLK